MGGQELGLHRGSCDLPQGRHVSGQEQGFGRPERASCPSYYTLEMGAVWIDEVGFLVVVAEC